MIRRNYRKKENAIEKFRLFDDLWPCVRQAVAACNFDVKLNEIMAEQHRHFQTGIPIENLAADILRRDQNIFHNRSKLSPDQRYPGRMAGDEVPFL